MIIWYINMVIDVGFWTLELYQKYRYGMYKYSQISLLAIYIDEVVMSTWKIIILACDDFGNFGRVNMTSINLWGPWGSVCMKPMNKELGGLEFS